MATNRYADPVATTSALIESIAPALADYEKALAEHSRNWDADGATCICGWRYEQHARRSANRALSLHITAAQKRAERIYDKESARLMAEARR